MLQNITQLYGLKLGATDGEIGHVQDFYFDDLTWAIRYIVADTGSWLPGRQVLLSHQALGNHGLGSFDAVTRILPVKLARQQIEDSPPIEAHRPVSRQHEENYYRYFGWTGYWQEGGMWSGSGYPFIPPPPAAPSLPPHHGHNQRDDIHLRSTKAVTGYKIQATDGPVGTVSSFMVHGKSWTIREIVAETGHWYAGKTIHLLPGDIDRISHEDSTVFMILTMEDIKQIASNDRALAAAGQP